MKRNCFAALLTLAAVLLLPAAALAGPPLVCHPFNIGDAKSLPFEGPGWSQVQSGYDTSRLVDDTMALLTPDTPVIVRMETLRRASLYARNDAHLAQALLDRVQARAAGIKDERRDRTALLAWFDLGYLAETYRQAVASTQHAATEAMKFQQPNPNLDGYALIQRAIERGGGAEMEFAAALVTASNHDRNHSQHLQNAITGAKPRSLLAVNLATHFPDAMKTAQLK